MRVAVLVKQVPVVETLALGPDGRLQREGLELEMNAYCRRAVARGVGLAQEHGGSCTVLTMGPPAAIEVLREAVAWGADDGVLITDPALAGSDTLATARALAAAIRRTGPYDLILTGRNSVDADTGQVGPAVAELLELPFLGGVRTLELDRGTLRARLEHDDSWSQVEVQPPVLISCAERLCAPCKVPADRRDAVPSDRLRSLTAADLGRGPWGTAGSPTVVGAIRPIEVPRARRQLAGPVPEQVRQAVRLLEAWGSLGPSGAAGSPATGPDSPVGPSAAGSRGRPDGSLGSGAPASPRGSDRALPTLIAVLVEPGRPQLARELLGGAAALAAAVGAGRIATVGPAAADAQLAATYGADESVLLAGAADGADVARGLADWCLARAPWAVIAPATMWGREVAARAAARLGAGLTGDAVELEVAGGRLVAWKPAFGGRLVAAITATSPIQMVTVRPGTLVRAAPRPGRPRRHEIRIQPAGRVRQLDQGRDDDLDVLATAAVVVGVGGAVPPEEHRKLQPLLDVLGAELAGTRRVTDRGWLPRSRQIGLTGRSIRPRLYVAVGIAGKFNHMVGVRAAGRVLAINCDPAAPVFEAADVGIVGDWQEVVPLLAARLDPAGAIPA